MMMNKHGELTPGEMPDLIFSLMPPTKEYPLHTTRDHSLMILNPELYHIVRDILVRSQTRETMMREAIETAKHLSQQDKEQIPDTNWDGKVWKPEDGEKPNE